MLNIREQRALETGALGKKIQSPVSNRLMRNSRIGKKRGICRESSHFLGELAEYLMESEELQR